MAKSQIWWSDIRPRSVIDKRFIRRLYNNIIVATIPTTRVRIKKIFSENAQVIKYLYIVYYNNNIGARVSFPSRYLLATTASHPLL